LCPDGFVYNLEVDNGNTYFAGGFLVHNCHHVAADSYMRIIEEFRKSGKLEESICIALGTTGKVIIFIATTITIGVVFWCLSKMMFQALMGALLAAILIFNMLGALFVVPSLLYVFKPKFIMKQYKPS